MEYTIEDFANEKVRDISDLRKVILRDAAIDCIRQIRGHFVVYYGDHKVPGGRDASEFNRMASFGTSVFDPSFRWVRD